MTPNIYTIHLNESALNNFLTAASHASHSYQMGKADRATCEAIWDFGEHLIDAIAADEDSSIEDVFRMAFGYNESYPTVDIPSDVIDSYLVALEALNTGDATMRIHPYQEAMDAFRRNEETLRNPP